VPQIEGTLLGIRSIVGLGVVFFIVLSLVFIALMPMTREKHEALCEAIRLKKQGREYDVTPFADLVR
jgi:Na+/melibiose symporter-like transporter